MRGKEPFGDYGERTKGSEKYLLVIMHIEIHDVDDDHTDADFPRDCLRFLLVFLGMHSVGKTLIPRHPKAHKADKIKPKRV